MRFKTFTLSLLSAGALFVSAPVLSGQTVQESAEFSKSPILQAPLYKVARAEDPDVEDWGASMKNTRVHFLPGVNPEADEFREAKRRANEAKQAKIDAGTYLPMFANKAAADTTSDSLMIQGTNYFANKFDGIPNDNDMAVGPNGWVIATTNSRLYVWDSIGAQRLLRAFGYFYSGTSLRYDPRVLYDSNTDRWIFVHLNSDAPSLSRVVVAFSQTSSPLGDWNVYTFNGNPDPAFYGTDVWTDYPQIAVTDEELFITGNMFTDANVSNGSCIWQIDKTAGFNGDSTISYVNYKSLNVNTFSMTPVQGFTKTYGDSLFLVATRNSMITASGSVWLHVITGKLSDPGTVFQTWAKTTSPTYLTPPDAAQKGTTQDLDTRGTRVRSAYYENNQIFFAMIATNSADVEIYLGKIDNPKLASFAGVTGQYLSSDSLEMGFPAVGYGGYTDSLGRNATVVFFNFAGPNYYPGNAAVLVRPDGTVGPPVMLCYGQTYVQQMTNPERWGDYADIAARHNTAGELWASGYYGYNTFSHQHGTWVSQIKVQLPDTTPPIAIDPAMDPAGNSMTVYPNPSTEWVNIDFAVPQTAMYRAAVYDLNGKLIHILMEDRLATGEAKLLFYTNPLPAGTYLLRVETSGTVAYSDKLVVVR